LQQQYDFFLLNYIHHGNDTLINATNIYHIDRSYHEGKVRDSVRRATGSTTHTRASALGSRQCMALAIIFFLQSVIDITAIPSSSEPNQQWYRWRWRRQPPWPPPREDLLQVEETLAIFTGRNPYRTAKEPRLSTAKRKEGSSECFIEKISRIDSCSILPILPEQVGKPHIEITPHQGCSSQAKYKQHILSVEMASTIPLKILQELPQPVNSRAKRSPPISS